MPGLYSCDFWNARRDKALDRIQTSRLSRLMVRSAAKAARLEPLSLPDCFSCRPGRASARPGTHTPQHLDRTRRMGPRFRGDDSKSLLPCVNSPIQFSNSQRSARRLWPVRAKASAIARIFGQAPGTACISLLSAHLGKESEGARDAKGPDGPTGLDASRHRGLSKSGAPPSLFSSVGAASRKSAKSKGVPRAVFVGLLHAIPRGRSFQCAFAC